MTKEQQPPLWHSHQSHHMAQFGVVNSDTKHTKGSKGHIYNNQESIPFELDCTSPTGAMGYLHQMLDVIQENLTIVWGFYLSQTIRH